MCASMKLKLDPWTPVPPPDLRGKMPENWLCVDCLVNTAPGLPTRIEAEQLASRKLDGFDISYTDQCEVYEVRNSVWKKAGMEAWGGCLCIGCLEKRIGRRLKRKDFPDDPLNVLPGTPRLRSRRD
jgi:hypothetical protein